MPTYEGKLKSSNLAYNQHEPLEKQLVTQTGAAVTSILV